MRPTPAAHGALLEEAGLVDDQHAVRLAQMPGDATDEVVANRIDVLSRAADEVLKVRGYDVAGELYQLPLSGLGQPFFRSRLATSPLGYTGARAWSSRRPNRGRIRSATRSSSRDHRTTSRSVTCASIPTSWGWAQDYAGLLQKDNCNTDSNLKQRGSDSVTFMPA
ncbi:MAG: hypothetical protein M3552_11305 [Planctomycetota bacterium]|nr:hypothetical protein [Planctomycetota bacterium]